MGGILLPARHHTNPRLGLSFKYLWGAGQGRLNKLAAITLGAFRYILVYLIRYAPFVWLSDGLRSLKVPVPPCTAPYALVSPPHKDCGSATRTVRYEYTKTSGRFYTELEVHAIRNALNIEYMYMQYRFVAL